MGFGNFNNMSEYISSVAQFSVLGMVAKQRIGDEENGLIKKAAVALFIPVVTAVATAVVTSQVLQEQVRQIKEENARLAMEIRRVDDRLESHKDAMQRWLVEHERTKERR